MTGLAVLTAVGLAYALDNYPLASVYIRADHDRVMAVIFLVMRRRDRRSCDDFIRNG